MHAFFFNGVACFRRILHGSENVNFSRRVRPYNNLAMPIVEDYFPLAGLPLLLRDVGQISEAAGLEVAVSKKSAGESGVRDWPDVTERLSS